MKWGCSSHHKKRSIRVLDSTAVAGLGSEGRRGGCRMQDPLGSETHQLRAPLIVSDASQEKPPVFLRLPPRLGPVALPARTGGPTLDL